jgi:hypothetical protein
VTRGRESFEQLMAQQLLRWREDPRLFIERFCYIRDKQRQTVPLLFNPAQDDYYRHLTHRDLILKPRQVGFTTFNCARFLADTLLHGNTYSAIVAHNIESTETIFEIVTFLWNRLPEWWHINHPPSRASKGELYWPTLNSRFYVGTSGSLTFGRGQTINNLLCSEVAHWRRAQEALASLFAAVPLTGTVVLESTPNGVGNYFYDLWQEARRGESDFASHFYVWWEDPTYRLVGDPLGVLTSEEQDLVRRYGLDDKQIRWRRRMQREHRTQFAQEFPEDAQSCFLANGGCCFSTAALLEMEARARPMPSRSIESPLPYHRWYQGGQQQKGVVSVLPGRLTIWKEWEERQEYAIGADVAEGVEGGNYSAAIIFNRLTGEQVAELHGHWRPDIFARLLAALAFRYGRPYLAVEANNHGHTALHVLRYELNYPFLYRSIEHGPRRGDPVLGWVTNARTKPLMLDELAAAIADGKAQLRSQALIQECLTFVSRDGVQGAQEGRFDDRVIATAIALQCCRREPARWSTKRPNGW